jgi:hypothetical protein
MNSHPEVADVIERTYNSLGFAVGALNDSPRSFNEILYTEIGKVIGYCSAMNWYVNPTDLEKLYKLRKPY